MFNKSEQEKIIVTTNNKDHRNVSYMINGISVQLTDGYNEFETVSGLTSKTVTRYFGNDLVTDLDSDGDDDVAFIVTPGNRR